MSDTNPTDWKNVWIVGASTGIGRELALVMDGKINNVAVTARSEDKLNDLAEGSDNITAFPLDITDQAATKECVAAIESAHGPIDLAVLGAGTWAMMDVEEFDVEAIKKGLDVNYLGVIYSLAELIPRMLERGRGHIAIIASVAGYRGLPNSVTYGPTKAALINLAETLNAELARKGITISIVNPGFVDTPMTQDNPFPMPALMDADDAARRLFDGLVDKDYEIIFPRRFVYGVKLLRILPNWLYFWVVKRFISKG